MAADAAWAEVESLRREVLHALTLDGTGPACQATDEAYAAFRRAQERAAAIEQLAEHSEGGYNVWAGAS